MSEPSIVELDHLSFAYAGGREVLRDACLSLRPNERIGLYGPNGSGKTTLFRLIMGLAKPREGDVLFHGRPMKDEKDFRALRCRMGLEGFEGRLTHRLSGGEKKLVSLAAVMAMQPEALLLDEPTNGLDPEARERLIDILQRLPTARIVISHDWDFLAETSTGYLTIVDGRLSDSAPSLAHAHTHMHPLGDAPHAHME